MTVTGFEPVSQAFRGPHFAAKLYHRVVAILHNSNQKVNHLDIDINLNALSKCLRLILNDVDSIPLNILALE